MSTKSSSAAAEDVLEEFVTMTLDGQLFGIPVMRVEDVLGPQHINPVPLAPPEIAGLINLRGRIVTAIDVRRRLGLPPRNGGGEGMSVVVEQGPELYSLIIDEIGEVLNLPVSGYEPNPSNLSPLWRDVSTCIYRLDGELMVVLDTDRLLTFGETKAA